MIQPSRFQADLILCDGIFSQCFLGLAGSSSNLFKQLDDALRDYEYYEETTTLKPVPEVTSDAVNPVTTLVNETNRLMLDLNSKYLEVADQVKKK